MELEHAELMVTLLVVDNGESADSVDTTGEHERYSGGVEITFLEVDGICFLYVVTVGCLLFKCLLRFPNDPPDVLKSDLQYLQSALGYQGNNDGVCDYDENSNRYCKDLGEHAYRRQLVDGIPKPLEYYLNDAELFEASLASKWYQISLYV